VRAAMSDEDPKGPPISARFAYPIGFRSCDISLSGDKRLR
jgi:hypothetical protein